jgi:hypothetical protein
VASAEEEESGRNVFSCLFLLDTIGLSLGVACEPYFLLNYLPCAEFLNIFLPAMMIPSRHITQFSMETFSSVIDQACGSETVTASQSRSIALASKHIS